MIWVPLDWIFLIQNFANRVGGEFYLYTFLFIFIFFKKCSL
ncbi:MAG: hypothetical protein ACI807_003572 [Paracoccaceae bacterium]|jgi:hypothetical protein